MIGKLTDRNLVMKRFSLFLQIPVSEFPVWLAELTALTRLKVPSDAVVATLFG